MGLSYMNMALARRGSGHRHIEDDHEATGRRSCLQTMEKGFGGILQTQEGDSRHLLSKPPTLEPSWAPGKEPQHVVEHSARLLQGRKQIF